MTDETTIVKITDSTYCSTEPAKTIFCFFIDGVLLYHCHDQNLASIYLKDIVDSYETKFKKAHPNYRVMVEKQNDWKYVIQRARDGVLFRGKPTATHIIEIKMSHQLLKPVPTK